MRQRVSDMDICWEGILEARAESTHDRDPMVGGREGDSIMLTWINISEECL